MPSELELKIRRGDKIGLMNDFQKVVEAIDMTNQPVEDRIVNVLFINQIRDYILEEVKG